MSDSVEAETFWQVLCCMLTLFTDGENIVFLYPQRGSSSKAPCKDLH